jgi:hypothetical protein
VFLSIAYPPLLINIDTHHSLSFREQYRCWRGTPSGSSTSEQHGKTICLLIDCISTIIDQYRHSPRSIFPRTTSILYWENNFSIKKIICGTEFCIKDDRWVHLHWWIFQLSFHDFLDYLCSILEWIRFLLEKIVYYK